MQGGGVDGVKESEDGEQKEVGARKGDVHFLATVFSNLSVVSLESLFIRRKDSGVLALGS